METEKFYNVYIDYDIGPSNTLVVKLNELCGWYLLRNVYSIHLIFRPSVVWFTHRVMCIDVAPVTVLGLVIILN